MDSHAMYLQAKTLWDHLENLTLSNDALFQVIHSSSGEDFTTENSAQEVADRIDFASTKAFLKKGDETEKDASKIIGGVQSKDLTQYGQQFNKFGQKEMKALSESLERTLGDLWIYYYADEESRPEKPNYLSLANDIEKDVKQKEADFHSVSNHLDTLVALHQEISKMHPQLHLTLNRAVETLSPAINANHSASHELLSTTMETLLLKLSVVRARLRASLYNYAYPSGSQSTISIAVHRLHEKLMAHQRALDIQESNVKSQLKDYQQLLELVDGKGGGFARVVEDLAIVNRETEECRKDLRRLGWTED